MEIDVLYSEDFAIVTIKGRIVIGRDVDSATRELLEIVERCATCLIIDMSNVTFIDSSGLGALASLKSAADSRKKKIVLSGLSFQIKRMLEITGLSQIFEIYSNPQDASLTLKQK
ncbi:MAG: STAS domain-containing protein [Acidobacteria bacterium]|nr:STAS domain-containing protein [Acidobacteriota bacterium]